MAEQLNHRVGCWLPRDQHALDAWLRELIDRVASRPPAPLHPVVDKFRALIEGDAEVYMLFHLMFEQVPHKPPYNEDPTGQPQVRDYGLMLRLLSEVLTRAPEYQRTSLVGFPINAILDWPMGTPAGFAAFQLARVNEAFKAVLDEWARFLGSPDSRYVLNDDPSTGWFGKNAMEDMPGFDDLYVCDPGAPYRGFQSWDDFFTRQLRPGARPVDGPGDDTVVVNACEAAPYRLATGVSPRDTFWLKGQPYSLEHMLAGDSLAPRFFGGTVYQAFLDAHNYHRWHAPVSGRVVKAYVRPGAYYSEPPSAGMDPAAPNDAQGYITHVATRALIFIEADNPVLGLVCVMPVGMAEVSTCDVRVYEGQHVTKGDELGTFRFGGSTHCVLFGPDVVLDFDLGGQHPGLDTTAIHVNKLLATVTSGHRPDTARG